MGPMPLPVAAAPAPRTNLSYGQFLARAVTAALVAPLGFAIAMFALFFLLAGCVAALGAAAAEPVDPPGPLATTTHVDGVSGASDLVLVVDVTGPILSVGGGAGPFGGILADGSAIKEQLEAAAEDPEVDAVVLRLNTPGGSVVGSELIGDGVEAVVAAGKPVVAQVDEISASGGMWAMAPADEIVVSRGSLVGSIGVILGPFSRYEGVVATEGGLLGGGVTTTGGIEQFFITAGAGKDAGNPYRDLTPDEQAMFQALVDGSYDQFVAHVSEHRGIDESVIIGEIGAGIFNGDDAIEIGLADRVGDFEDAHVLAADLAEVDGDYDVRAVSIDLGFLGLLLQDDTEPPAADLSGLCSSTPRAHAFFGDLGAFCRSGG